MVSISKCIRAEVEIDVQLSDFTDTQLLEELEGRGIPHNVLEPLRYYLNTPISTPQKLREWEEFCGAVKW